MTSGVVARQSSTSRRLRWARAAAGVDLLARRGQKVQGLRVLDEEALLLEEEVGLVDDLGDEFRAQELELGSVRGDHGHLPISALASLTARAAFSAYPWAPISSAHFRVAGAPPTRTLNFPASPLLPRSSMNRFWLSMVVVRRAERQMMSAPFGLGLFDEALELDVGPEVEDLEAVGLEHRRHQVLPDVVDVPLDGPDHDLAQRAGLDVGLGHLRLEDVHGRLHAFGARDELGQEIFALLPQVADLLDAGDVPLVDDLVEVESQADGLQGQLAGRGLSPSTMALRML